MRVSVNIKAKRIGVRVRPRRVSVVTVIRQGAPGLPGSAGFIWNEIPTGEIDGVNDTFTLTQAPSAASKVLLSVNGLIYLEGADNDYTISGQSIIFTPDAIPHSGDTLLVTYSIV